MNCFNIRMCLPAEVTFYSLLRDGILRIKVRWHKVILSGGLFIYTVSYPNLI